MHHTEQIGQGVVVSATRGTMRILGSVARFFHDMFFRALPSPTKSQPTLPAQHALHVETKHVDIPLPVKRDQPEEVRRTVVQQLPVSENIKPRDLDSFLSGVDFPSKLERVQAETFVFDARSSDKDTRAKAFAQIARLSGASAFGVLRKLLLSETESIRIIELISALSSLADDGMIDKKVFSHFLKDPNPNVRQAVVRSLSKYRDDESLALLLSALADREAEVRRQTLNCLGWFFGERSAVAIVRSLHDVDSGVRKSAALLSGSLKLPQAISGLITLLSDQDRTVQKTASDALIKITGKNYGFKVSGSAKSKSDALEDWRFWWRDNQARMTVK